MNVIHYIAETVIHVSETTLPLRSQSTKLYSKRKLLKILQTEVQKPRFNKATKASIPFKISIAIKTEKQVGVKQEISLDGRGTFETI